MKLIPFFLIILLGATLMLSSCNNKKKAEQKEKARLDSIARADSIAALHPAPATLAFGALAGYEVNKADKLKDSLNFLLMFTDEEFDRYFKKSAGTAADPGFIINFVVGVIGEPTDLSTTFEMEKVELGEESINLFLHVKRGEKVPKRYRPGQVFAVERHDGYPKMQFYVNGKPGGVIELPVN